MVIFQSAMKLMIRGSASVTSSLQSKIEQAVFFGERSDVSPASRFVLLADNQNPLSFSLQSDVEGDVGEAVEHVSNDIVASSKSSTVIPLLSLT
jgi:hypothetical protein